MTPYPLFTDQKNMWMNSHIVKIFEKIVFLPLKSFQSRQNTPLKAILLIDNEPSHAGETELQKRVTFLHPNVTPLNHPMDQGVLENLDRKCVC